MTDTIEMTTMMIDPVTVTTVTIGTIETTEEAATVIGVNVSISNSDNLDRSLMVSFSSHTFNNNVF